jgi:hypothetical protein
MRRVLFFGDRDWANAVPIGQALSEEVLKAGGAEHLLVIAGGARGADSIAETIAKRSGIHVARVDALWDSYGRAAGPIRNGVMKALEPDYAHGFHSDIENSKGTKNMRDQLRKAGVPFEIHDGNS